MPRDAQFSRRPRSSGAYVRWSGRGVDGDAMITADAYFDRHGYDVETREPDSHGNRHDADAFRALVALRDEYRTKVAALMPGLSKKGTTIVQEYLDGDEGNEHDILWWLSGCENHERGEDA